MKPFLFGFAALATSLLASCSAEPQQVPAALAGIPASKFCKEVDNSACEVGRLAIAVGYSQPEGVEWDKLKTEQGDYDLDAESPLLINVLIDRKKDRALALLPLKHFGTQKDYNHEHFETAWSPKADYLIAMKSWKWETEAAVLCSLDAQGRVRAQLDLLPMAREQLIKVLTHKDPDSAKRFETKYAVQLYEPSVNEQGEVRMKAEAQIPKDMDATEVLIQIRFKAAPGPGGKLAVSDLKVEEEEG